MQEEKPHVKASFKPMNWKQAFFIWTFFLRATEIFLHSVTIALIYLLSLCSFAAFQLASFLTRRFLSPFISHCFFFFFSLPPKVPVAHFGCGGEGFRPAPLWFNCVRATNRTREADEQSVTVALMLQLLPSISHGVVPLNEVGNWIAQHKMNNAFLFDWKQLLYSYCAYICVAPMWLT